jgi:nitroreductase
MAEFAEVVRARRMTRSFDTRPVPPDLLNQIVDLASRAPSAGKTQGWHLVVLEGADTSRFWDITLPPMRRGAFRWKRLLEAPVIAIPLADPRAYVERYSEADKRASGLGAGTEAWPAPYWTVDTSMSVMTMLLAAEDLGLGALFFGIFRGERELRRALAIPPVMQILGAVALGYPASVDAGGGSGDDTNPGGKGRSAPRKRRTPDEIIHRGSWRPTT